MKTSVWLGDDIAERWKQSGLPLAELVRRGLDAGEPEELDGKIRRLLREEHGPAPSTQDPPPDAGEIRRIVRDELERVAGQSHA